MSYRVERITITRKRSDVETIAQRERSSLRQEGAMRDRLLDFVKKLNGKIEYVDSGALEETVQIDENGKFSIFLPKDSSIERDNFTIAHELGHYLLHRDEGAKGQATSFARRGSNRMEWEANWFAAEFLMPRAEVERVVAEHGKSPYNVAAEFGVSLSAARIRLEYLNLI